MLFLIELFGAYSISMQGRDEVCGDRFIGLGNNQKVDYRKINRWPYHFFYVVPLTPIFLSLPATHIHENKSYERYIQIGGRRGGREANT